jgi:hypothetical protein
VHDHDQLRLAAQTPLHHAAHRHLVVPEHLRDLSEDARAVVDLQVKVEGHLDVLGDLEVRVLLEQRGSAGDHGDDVAEHRRCRLGAARAGARHRDLGDRGRLDHHGVERPLDRREWMPGVEEAGKDANADLRVADPLGDPEQLQREAELLRVGEVVRLDLLDALIGDVLQLHGRPEGEPGEDRHLRRGIGTADVIARVRLRIAEILGLLQGLLVGEATPGHLGEDVVGGAVDDPEHLLDRDRAEALLDHADHRNRARDGRLEPKLGTALPRGGDQLLAVLGEQLLVGGHHMATIPQGAGNVVERRVDAADQLDDDLAGRQDLVEVTVLGAQHPGHDRAPPGDLLDHGRSLLEEVAEGTAHGAPAQDADVNVIAHWSLARRSSQVSRRTTTLASPSRQKITGGLGTPL